VYIPKYKLCFEFQASKREENTQQKERLEYKKREQKNILLIFSYFFLYRIPIITQMFGILNDHQMKLKKLIISLIT
jgi:hypothetical protein